MTDEGHASTRTASGWRNMLEVRVRKIAGTRSIEERRKALTEIRDLAEGYLMELEAGNVVPDDEDELDDTVEDTPDDDGGRPDFVDDLIDR